MERSQGVLTTLQQRRVFRVIPKLKLQLLRDVLNRFIKRTTSAINTAVYGQPYGNTAYNTNNSVSTLNKVNHSNNPSLQLNENNLLDR